MPPKAIIQQAGFTKKKSIPIGLYIKETVIESYTAQLLED
jgi:hypothetical protein